MYTLPSIGTPFFYIAICTLSRSLVHHSSTYTIHETPAFYTVHRYIILLYCLLVYYYVHCLTIYHVHCLSVHYSIHFSTTYYVHYYVQCLTIYRKLVHHSVHFSTTYCVYCPTISTLPYTLFGYNYATIEKRLLSSLPSVSNPSGCNT